MFNFISNLFFSMRRQLNRVTIRKTLRVIGYVRIQTFPCNCLFTQTKKKLSH